MRNAFTLDISTDNAAFEDEPAAEVARILRRIADKLEQGQRDGIAADVNGNRCGSFHLTSADD